MLKRTNKTISLKIKLKGDQQNKFAVGSTVELFSGSEILRQELIPSRGFQSSIDYTMTFGIGTKKLIPCKLFGLTEKRKPLKK